MTYKVHLVGILPLKGQMTIGQETSVWVLTSFNFHGITYFSYIDQFGTEVGVEYLDGDIAAC